MDELKLTSNQNDEHEGFSTPPPLNHFLRGEEVPFHPKLAIPVIIPKPET